MEELVLQDKPGLFSRLGKMFTREDVETEEPLPVETGGKSLTIQRAHRYLVTVRRGVTTFDDAMEAAHGLKRGEQQILNLSTTEPMLRQKIVDFMSGVNFAQEGTWEEVGEHIYVVAPATAFVEVAPASTRIIAAAASRN
jgi:cell division inhibitor SepF